eukprot:TRINITY_DN18561_c0_g1_i1.p1 TRINITY_DN18561_c0_g1~~TRINITY_DN18561_c0_g1_i1.p1  ORF type:complete len:497 (+),score=93.99 TRINITY_DN18561_c0_g1_i1:34-1491(+)
MPVSPPRKGDDHYDESLLELQDLLRTKIEENQQLVEYISYLEEAKEEQQTEEVEVLNDELTHYKQQVIQLQAAAQAKDTAEDLARENEELKDAVRVANEEAVMWKQKAEEQEEVSRAYQTDVNIMQQRIEELQKELALIKTKADRWQHTAEAESETSSSLRQELEIERSSSRSAGRSDDNASEMQALKKAVIELRSEVQRQQEELKRGTSPQELQKITAERDTLRQVVAKQRQHLADVKAAQGHKVPPLKPGLPPLPPGSPPAAPAYARLPPEDQASDDGCSTEWCEQLRSEAPSRTSGADTPSLPVSARGSHSVGHSISPVLRHSSDVTASVSGSQSAGHSISPILRHSSEVASSGRNSRSCGATSVNISESSGSESVPALSVSPCPTLPTPGFLPVEAPHHVQHPQAAHAPRACQAPQPHCNTIRPSSYASQAGARAVQLSRTPQGSKARTTSPTAGTGQRRKTEKHNPRDRAFAPLVFSIHS